MTFSHDLFGLIEGNSQEGARALELGGAFLQGNQTISFSRAGTTQRLGFFLGKIFSYMLWYSGFR